jgi:poly(hydroxyalkanoate) depolymerase family esterase
MRSVFVVSALLLLLARLADGGTLQPVAEFGANPGALDMFEYVPTNLGAKRPLVVVLHGCTQQATGMAPAGWNTLADQLDFAVIYPEQQTTNNPIRCFNWAGENGDPANLERGKGENASILAMIDHAIATHDLDPARVFITGVSAGGAFTAVMLATWPERFAGGAIFAGMPYRCATSLTEAYTCTNPGIVKPAAQWGDLVRAAADGPWPRVQIWQGSTDTTVAPANAVELVKQWTDVHGVDASADATETLDNTTREEHRDGSRVLVETFTIAGMGHAVPIGGDDCTATSGAFFSDQGICSTARAAAFFGLAGDGGGSGNGSGGSGSGSGNDDEAGMSGGCSTRSGAGLGLIALALLGFVRRR